MTSQPMHRRQFVAATAAIGATALSGISCAPVSPGATPPTAEERKSIEENGFSVRSAPDTYSNDKTRVEISLQANAKGRAVEAVTIAPLGVAVTYRDGTSKEFDLTADMLRDGKDGTRLSSSVAMHLQVADPERKNLKLAVINPEQSGTTLAVFVDRAGIAGKASRYSRPNPVKLALEADIAGASHSGSPYDTKTVLGLDARIGGDSRNIDLTVTGLNPAQETRVQQKHDARSPGSRIYPADGLHLQDNLSINLAPVEVRSDPQSPVHFRMSDGQTISDAIGRLAQPQRTPGH